MTASVSIEDYPVLFRAQGISGALIWFISGTGSQGDMDGMWVEKYRPTTLSDVVGQKEVVDSLSGLLKNVSQMPHLLFSGSAGVGKTTTALCVTRQVLGENQAGYTLELNASDERGIEMVRQKVKKFSRFAGISDIPFKIIILDEADEMTSGAQTALRRIIEDAAEYCRFILIANNISKIIDPIQSRCAVFRFKSVSREEVVARLADIIRAEGVEAEAGALESVYDHTEGDMRHAINLMQAAAAGGRLTRSAVESTAGLAKTSEVDRILGMALEGNFKEARQKTVELIKVYGVSESDFLKYITAAVFRADLEDPLRGGADYSRVRLPHTLRSQPGDTALGYAGRDRGIQAVTTCSRPRPLRLPRRSAVRSLACPGRTRSPCSRPRPP